MSYMEPVVSGFELTASERDPAHHAVVPSNDEQDLAFRSIRAIDPNALQPFGPVSLTSERKTPKGIRPMVWIRLNETKSAAIFEVTLHTEQCIQVHVPYESWRLATCDSEAVRAVIQRAYLNLLRRKPDPGVVKPGMVSLKILSKYDPQPYIDSESTRRVLSNRGQGRSATPQNAGATSEDALTPPANERVRVPSPAYDDVNLPKRAVRFARDTEHKPIMHMATSMPTHKAYKIGSDGPGTNAVLDPYAFKSSSWWEIEDQHMSTMTKPISPLPNSPPLDIAPSLPIKTSTKKSTFVLSVEKENSKRTERRADGQSMDVVPQGSANKAEKASSKNDAVIGGAPFEGRRDARYFEPYDAAWAHYAPVRIDPAGVDYLLSVPSGVKDAATTLPSVNESAQDSGEMAQNLAAELIPTPVGFPELEKLMQEKVPLDLTGEVVVADYREPKHGGFAFVYKGLWKGKEVAVKKLKCKKNLKKPAPWEASMQRRLTREINVWAAVKHPNIAEFLGFAEDFGDFPAMISTWCNPGTARDYLDDNEDMAIEVRIGLVQDVTDGIEYLHSLKIIHGDLKPANVLIDDNYVARLCDFGLVRLDDWQGPAGMTTTSPYMGTERYKAPELFITMGNSHPIATSEGDIWALGCIALEVPATLQRYPELITQQFIDTRLPYERYHYSVALAKAIADGEPPASRPKGSDSDSLQHLWYLLEACWAWYPENRFNVSQLVEGLALLSDLQNAHSEA